jgi:hypothetical protein
MTRKEWILANLEGKVQLRALRACGDRVIYDSCERDWTLKSLFTWYNTKEGHDYWAVIHGNLTNPDQYLPEGYIDVDHIPDIGKMVEEETTTLSLENWIRNKLAENEEMHHYDIATESVRIWIDQYNELKKTQVKP